jgi:hypothetical protein
MVFPVKGLASRAQAGFDLAIQPPRIAADLWGFQDLPVQVRWSGTGGEGVLVRPLRAFPAPFQVFPGDVLKIFRQEEFGPWPFPDMEFQPGGLDDALKSLKGGYAALWVDEDTAALDPMELRKFLERGGGLVVTGASLLDPSLLPVEVGPPTTKRDLTLPPHALTEAVRPLRSRFAGSFPAVGVTVRDWGEVIATWDDGTPAIVVSREPQRRVAFVASRLPGDYRFGDGGIGPGKELWPQNLWPIAALYHDLLRWAAGLGRE